jgi:peptide deformylase
MKLSLAYYGDPILRKKTKRVAEITQEIKDLVADMIETMHVYKGIGLAAPQVHRDLAIFITYVPQEQPDGKWIPGPLKVFINAKVLSISEEEEIRSEGCLSMPKLYGEVSRPVKIKIQATDLEGKQFEEELQGLDARCFLHENDHINGVLFIDRIFGKARKDLEPKLKEIKKNLSSK